jgi:tetratricopeptide (TPR) repeat protein
MLEGKTKRGPTFGIDLWGYHSMLHVALFAVALAVRLIFVYQFYWHPLFEMLPVDAQEFSRQAMAIANGDFLHPDAVYINPFYPLFLALHFAVFGISYLPVLCVQAVLDALSCLLVAHIGAGLFDSKAGLIAGLIYALCGTAVFYTGVLLAPTALTFSILCFLAALLHAGRHPKWRNFGGAGVLLGIIILGAPNLMIFMLALPVWFWFRFKDSHGLRAATRWFAVLVLGTCAVLSLMSVRNHRIMGRWWPVPVHGGINFYIGNHSGAEGFFMRLPHVSGRPIEQVKTSIRAAEKASGKRLTPSEASWYWLTKGLQFWRNQPGQTAALFLKKMSMFWRKEELPLNISYAFTRQHMPVLRLPFMSFGIIAPFALMGIVLSIRNREVLLPALVVICHMIAVVLFFVSARYRFPVTPVLAIFAGGFVIHLLEIFPAGKPSTKILVGCATTLLIIGLNYPFAHFSYLPVDKFPYDYGNILYRKSRYAEAGREFEKVVAQNPKHVNAHFRLGQAYVKQRRLAEAEVAWKEVLRLDPNFPGIREQLERLSRQGVQADPPQVDR